MSKEREESPLSEAEQAKLAKQKAKEEAEAKILKTFAQGLKTEAQEAVNALRQGRIQVFNSFVKIVQEKAQNEGLKEDEFSADLLIPMLGHCFTLTDFTSEDLKYLVYLQDHLELSAFDAYVLQSLLSGVCAGIMLQDKKPEFPLSVNLDGSLEFNKSFSLESRRFKALKELDGLKESLLQALEINRCMKGKQQVPLEETLKKLRGLEAQLRGEALVKNESFDPIQEQIKSLDQAIDLVLTEPNFKAISKQHHQLRVIADDPANNDAFIILLRQYKDYLKKKVDLLAKDDEGEYATKLRNRHYLINAHVEDFIKLRTQNESLTVEILLEVKEDLTRCKNLQPDWIERSFLDKLLDILTVGLRPLIRMMRNKEETNIKNIEDELGSASPGLGA